VIAFTPWAEEILGRADAAARRLNPDARVRIVRDASGVRFELTDEPAPTDLEVDGGGFRVLVQDGLDGVVDVVEPHDRLILRAPDDPERSARGSH